MIQIPIRYIDEIKRSEKVKRTYEIKINDRGIELIKIDDKNENILIHKTYDEKNRLVESKAYELVDDIIYSDALLLKYFEEFDEITKGRLLYEESYLYEKNLLVMKTITNYTENGFRQTEDHMYNYDYKNRVILEAITKYHIMSADIKATKPMIIKEMLRINTFYDNLGNRFDTHIRIQRNGYFIYELIKEVFIPIIQPYQHFQIHHVKIDNKITSIEVPIAFNYSLKTKYKVYGKNDFEFYFDYDNHIIGDKMYHVINYHQKIIKIEVNIYHKINYHFIECNENDTKDKKNLKLIIESD